MYIDQTFTVSYLTRSEIPQTTGRAVELSLGLVYSSKSDSGCLFGPIISPIVNKLQRKPPQPVSSDASRAAIQLIFQSSSCRVRVDQESSCGRFLSRKRESAGQIGPLNSGLLSAPTSLLAGCCSETIVDPASSSCSYPRAISREGPSSSFHSARRDA